MANKVLVTFKTDHKINAIKAVRTILGWGLYEAKEAVENGIIFDNLDALHNFLCRLRVDMGNSPFVAEIAPFKRSRVPQDASGLTIWA